MGDPAASEGKRSRRRVGLALAVSVPVLLYALCGLWIWRHHDLFAEAVSFPLDALLLSLVAAALAQGVANPLRHALLVSRLGIRLPALVALRDRTVILAAKSFVPAVVGDPVGHIAVVRGEGGTPTGAAATWVTDKALTFIAHAILVLGTAVGVWAGGAAAVATFVVATGALAVWFVRLGPAVDVLGEAGSGAARGGAAGGGAAGGRARRFVRNLLAGFAGFRGYRTSGRLALLGVTLAIQALTLLAYAAPLAAVMDNGWADVTFFRLVIVVFSGMLPTMFGGAGTREAATLVVFAGYGDPRALFLATFLAAVVFRVGPAALGLPFLRSATGGAQR